MFNAETVTTPDRLAHVVAQTLQANAVAVDTEFFWERTFYPILGLVQIATADSCWLINTVSLRDIRALGAVMASPAVTKVLHDAPQDLSILARATGTPPQSVFDTRLAAGFAGLSSTCSLQALLRQTLDVELSKAETRSDWLRRPLSANQLRYAADDVVHLLPLREALLARCSDTARAGLAEELVRLDDPAAYRDRDPRLMYMRVKGSSRLGGRQLAILRELAAWREELARTRDWPRAHVLPDDLLVTLAQQAPADRAALGALQGLPRNMPDAVVADVSAAILRGLAQPDNECPAPAPHSDFAAQRALKPHADRLLAQIAAAGATQGIDPALVASRADAESFVQQLSNGDVTDHPLARGWRKAFAAGFSL